MKVEPVLKALSCPKMVFNKFCLFDSFPVSIETFFAGGWGWVAGSNGNKANISVSLRIVELRLSLEKLNLQTIGRSVLNIMSNLLYCLKSCFGFINHRMFIGVEIGLLGVCKVSRLRLLKL